MLVSNIESRSEMFLTFDRMYMTPNRKPSLKAIVLLSDLTPDELQTLYSTRRKLRRDYSLSYSSLGDGLNRVTLEKIVRDRRVTGQAILETNPSGYWVMYTNEPGYFVRHVMEPFLNKLYPYVSRVYFNYKQILRFLKSLETEYRGSSVMTSIAVERQSKTGGQKKRGTLLLWEPGAENELGKQAEQYRLWIDHVGFEVRDQSDLLVLAGSMTGKGVARLRYGSFTEFSQKFLHHFVATAIHWKRFFSNRERKIIDGRVQLSPYRLQYPFELEKRQITEISQRLGNVYSFSTIHESNPYFAASVSDYVDGSSFGVTVLRSRVTITPLSKATPSALWKLASRIQSAIGECEIEGVTQQVDAV